MPPMAPNWRNPRNWVMPSEAYDAAAANAADHGAGAGPVHRAGERLLHEDAGAALLDVAGQEDDAEVDAVADDDGAEERRVGVELVDAERPQRGQAERVDRGQQQRRQQDEDAAPPAVVDDDGADHRDQDQHGRDGEVAHQRGRLLDEDGDVAAVADAHARRVARGAAQRRQVGLDAREELGRAALAGGVLAHLDEGHGEVEGLAAEAVVGEPGGGVAEPVVVLLLDVGDVDRGRRLALVEQGAHLLGHLVVAARLDAGAHDAQVGQVEVEGAVLLEEGALFGVADAHAGGELRGVSADPGGQIVDEPLAGGEVRGVAGVDDDAEEEQPRDAGAELVDGEDAGRVAGEQLLRLGAQVGVERRGAQGGGDGEEQRADPEQAAVPQRPGDERARARRRAVVRDHDQAWGRGSSARGTAPGRAARRAPTVRTSATVPTQ